MYNNVEAMRNLLYRVFQNIGLIVISLGLLYGGVAILQTGIPFWSLVYGIPAVFLGIVMSLITFNEVARNRIAKASEYHQIPCRVCGKMSLAPMLIESVVCPDCQYKMAVKLQVGVLVFLALLAIPVTYHLSQTAQNLEQSAQTLEPSPICEAGKWNPQACQCGNWEPENTCEAQESARRCQNVLFCCKFAASIWRCRLPSRQR